MIVFAIKRFIAERRLIAVLLLMLLLAACAKTQSNFGKNRPSQSVDRALIHAQLARGYLQQKQYDVAKSELDQALGIDPNHSQSNYVMGLLMIALQQLPEAETHFVTALKSDSENASAAHDYGLLLCHIGKESQSIEYFDLAAQNPFFDKPELSFMRAGECLVRVNDPRAEQYLQRALKINPKLSPALRSLAIIKFDTGEYLSARAFIERYLAISEPQPDPLLLAFKIESILKAEAAANKYRAMLLNDFPGTEQAQELRHLQR